MYSSKISLLLEVELLLSIGFGEAAGDGGIDPLPSCFDVSFVIKSGATIGDKDTGVSIGVILFIPIDSVSTNFWRDLDKAVANSSSLRVFSIILSLMDL